MTNREWLATFRSCDAEYKVSIWAKENIDVNNGISDLLWEFLWWLGEEHKDGE